MELLIRNIRIIEGQDVIDKYPHLGITTPDKFVCAGIVDNEKKIVELTSPAMDTKRKAVTMFYRLCNEYTIINFNLP